MTTVGLASRKQTTRRPSGESDTSSPDPDPPRGSRSIGGSSGFSGRAGMSYTHSFFPASTSHSVSRSFPPSTAANRLPLSERANAHCSPSSFSSVRSVRPVSALTSRTSTLR